MDATDSTVTERNVQKDAVASFLQIAALAVLLYWCFRILSPFITIAVWALIVSVAIFPLHTALAQKLGGRETLSAALLVLLCLAMLIAPAVMMAESSVSALSATGHALREGSLVIPQPDASVTEWPVIGERLYAVWSGAATNLSATLNKFQPQLLAVGHALAEVSGSLLFGILTFSVALIVAGAFLVNANAGYRLATSISSGLQKERGKEFVDLAIATIRSVAKGVLGVAIVQALLSAIGLAAVGVPAPGVWAGAVLLLAVVQLPPLLILAPIAVWVFSVADPVSATIFAVYATIVSFSDTILKPMLLGRGMNIPMLVILLGAIGGAASMGISGLFVGSVTLAVGYEILQMWLRTDVSSPQ